MINIHLRDRYVDYEFTIKDKFTLIRGDTASGKTTLYDLFASYSENHANVECLAYKKLEALPKSKRYTYSEYANLLNTTDDTVFILDEDSSFFSIIGFEKLLLDSNNYFIIIQRERLFKDLPINLRSIVSIHSSGKYHTLKPIYTVPDVMHDFTLCVCEDCKSGKIFLKQFISNCESCEGKDNFVDTMLHYKEPLLLVYDTVGIGESYTGILKAIKQYKYPVTHMNWESFEGYIINNTVYKNAPRGAYDCSYNSYEDYAEQVLFNALKSYPGMHYAKGKLPQCLRKTRCTSCDKTASCPYVMYGDNALLGDPVKKVLDHYKDTPEKETETLSPELIERVWSQMPEVVKPQYGSTKEEIATNYYKEYSYLFE